MAQFMTPEERQAAQAARQATRYPGMVEPPGFDSPSDRVADRVLRREQRGRYTGPPVGPPVQVPPIPGTPSLAGPLRSFMPKNGKMKGAWGDIGAMRGAESVLVGGFTAGGPPVRHGKGKKGKKK